MTATMKGLLKGLRYISQIFENSDEDEPEMQIGNPTDVKHVAHIGWDGPSVSSPSWMNDFKAPNESVSAPLSFPPKNDTLLTRRHSEDVLGNKQLEIPPRRFPSLDDPSPDAPPEDRKQSRRRHSAGGSINSPGRDIANGHKPRKHQHNSSLGLDPTSNGASSPPSIPKKTRKKKPKDKESSSLVNGVTDGLSMPGGGSDGPLKLGGGLANGSTKSKTKGHRKSESKSKDIDSTTSALKGLKLNEGMDSDEGIPRHDLDL